MSDAYRERSNEYGDFEMFEVVPEPPGEHAMIRRVGIEDVIQDVAKEAGVERLVALHHARSLDAVRKGAVALDQMVNRAKSEIERHGRPEPLTSAAHADDLNHVEHQLNILRAGYLVLEELRDRLLEQFEAHADPAPLTADAATDAPTDDGGEDFKAAHAAVEDAFAAADATFPTDDDAVPGAVNTVPAAEPEPEGEPAADESPADAEGESEPATGKKKRAK